MPRRKLDDDFNTGPDAIDAPDGRTRKRVTIPLRDDGTLDLSGMRAASKDRLASALAADPQALSSFGAATGVGLADVELKQGPITPQHIEVLITIYEHIERWTIPPVIEKQNPGAGKIPKLIVERSFVFSKEWREKLGPPGALFLNQTLPPWLLEYLSKAGPGAEFLSGMIMCTWMQTMQCMTLWKQSIIEGTMVQPSEVKPNGAEVHNET